VNVDRPVHESARQAVEADVAAISALQAEARRHVHDARGGRLLVERDRQPGESARLLARGLAGTEDVLVAVGTLDESVVGFAVACEVPTASGEPIAEIVELWVTPEARQVGVGEELLGLIERWAVERGCGGIDADALPGDRATKNFFESHGLVARSIRVHRSLDRPERAR
jgi:ribosomal protein S18 acetylase RimI-like enzyme